MRYWRIFLMAVLVLSHGCKKESSERAAPTPASAQASGATMPSTRPATAPMPDRQDNGARATGGVLDNGASKGK